MSPYFSNTFVDTNFFDRTDPIEDIAVDQILEIFSNEKINLLIPYSVKDEINHPNTPVDIKNKASKLIYSIEVTLNENELNIHQKIRNLLQAKAIDDKHNKDAFHIVESQKNGGGCFITKDKRILNKAKEIYEILPIKILKPSDYITICNNILLI